MQARPGQRGATRPRCWTTRGSEVAQLGLKYVHNDTCYPALLVIGQLMDAV